MLQYKIMNVIMPDMPPFYEVPSLLVRGTNEFHKTDEAWSFAGPATYDFMTYFNAVSVRKWNEYTNAKGYGLHFEVRGGTGSITITVADQYDYAPQETEIQATFEASSEWSSFDLELPGSSNHVLEAFKLTCNDTECQLKNIYYYALVEEPSINPVELSLSTTTFKKEEFITRNIELAKNEILACSDPIAEHFYMHVVDNGRSLDVDTLTTDKVSIHPNDNVGGAGGFARGMIESMEQTPKATHVLLMDDDVLISPESIKRTYTLLSLVNDDYKEAFVSGAMMNMEEPSMRWEEMGFIGFDGAFHPLKPPVHMETVHDVVDGEAYDNPYYMPNCGDQAQCYAAWWYCAIPMTQIEKNGLPLPIFVRGDDVEYSRRCNPKFMTMNSISIWHAAFHTRYNAAQERYQMTRNCFIDQFVSDFAPASDFVGQMTKAFKLELRKFNYTNAALILDGFEDFLKGPEWIMQPVAMDAFMSANKRSEKLKPIAEAQEELAELGVNLGDLTDWKVWRDLPYSMKDRIIDKATLNGQQYTGAFTTSGKVCVIDNVGWAEPFGKLRGVDTIVAFDMPNKRVAIRRLDREQFKALSERFKQDMATYKSKEAELKKAYSDAKAEMTSIPFWKQYLGI